MEQGGCNDEEPQSVGEVPGGQMHHGVDAAGERRESQKKAYRYPYSAEITFSGVTALATLLSAMVMANQCGIMSTQTTLISDQKTISDAQRGIAEKQTVILNQQRTIMAAEHRAWVFPADVRHIPKGTFQSDSPFAVTIKNVGPAPALDVGGVHWVRMSEVELNTERVPDCNADCSTCPVPASGNPMIAPGTTLEVDTNTDGTLSEADLAGIEAMSNRPYVFGRITYRDHLGNPHVTIYCRRLRAIDGAWRMTGCPQHECAN